MPTPLTLSLTPTNTVTSRAELRRLERALAGPGGQTGSRTYVAMTAGRGDVRHRVLGVGPLATVKARVKEVVAAVNNSGAHWGWTAAELRTVRLYGPFDTPADPTSESLSSETGGSICYHDVTSEFWCPTDVDTSALQSVQREDVVSVELTITYRSAAGSTKKTIAVPPNVDTITLGESSARAYIREHYDPVDGAAYQKIVVPPPRVAGRPSRRK